MSQWTFPVCWDISCFVHSSPKDVRFLSYSLTNERSSQYGSCKKVPGKGGTSIAFILRRAAYVRNAETNSRAEINGWSLTSSFTICAQFQRKWCLTNCDSLLCIVFYARWLQMQCRIQCRLCVGLLSQIMFQSSGAMPGLRRAESSQPFLKPGAAQGGEHKARVRTACHMLLPKKHKNQLQNSFGSL